MSDDKTKRAPQDKTRISLNEDYEVRYWTKRLGDQQGSAGRSRQSRRSRPTWRRTNDATMPGKRVQFDDETWDAVRLLASDSMRDFQELADEAFRDLLAKHNRPVGLRTQMKDSAKALTRREPTTKADRRGRSKRGRTRNR